MNGTADWTLNVLDNLVSDPTADPAASLPIETPPAGVNDTPPAESIAPIEPAAIEESESAPSIDAAEDTASAAVDGEQSLAATAGDSAAPAEEPEHAPASLETEPRTELAAVAEQSKSGGVS